MKRKKSQVSKGAKVGKVCQSEVSSVLRKCGFKLGKTRHTIVNDSCTFVKSLGLELLSTSQRDNFFVGLQDYIEDSDNLRVAMLPAELENRESHLIRDSLIRLLLLVPNLGEPLLELLLERLPLMSDDNMTCNMTALLVQQLRWLPSTPANLVNKLNEVLPACPVDVQCEVISALPEMVSDVEHADICTLLLDLMSTIELVPTILDSLSNLTLSDKMTESVCLTVEEHLSALNAEAIPSALKFLLLTQPDPLVAVNSIRDNIDFSSLSTEEDKESEVLALQTLEQALRFHNNIQKTWLKVLTKPASIEAFDILVLLLLMRVSNKPKPVLALIRNHVRTGLVTWISFDNVYNQHCSSALLYNTEALTLAHYLLMSYESKVGATLYSNLFTLGDLHTQQEVIGALISHIGSGDEKEIDAGISTLHTIQENNTKAFTRFSPLLQGLLDHLTQLTLQQSRQVLTLLVHISDCRGSGGVADDLHIITRKYMAHSSMKLQKLGVVGTTALIQGLSEPSECQATQARHPASTLSNREFGHVKSLLEKIKANCSTKPALFSLFCDEMSVSLARAPTDLKVVKMILEDFNTTFQSKFITETSCSKEGEFSDILNLDTFVNSADSDVYICVNMWHYLTEEMAVLQQLPPLIRLISTCVSILDNDNVIGINSLLGCPIRFSPLKDISDHGERGVHGMFFLVNWVVELINTFVEEKGCEMQGKVFQRIHDLNMLQGILKNALFVHPGLVPFPATFDVDIAPVTGDTKKKVKARAGINSTSADLADQTISASISATMAGTVADRTILSPDHTVLSPGPTDTVTKPGVSLAKYRPYIRELELKVFSVLNVKPVRKSMVDSDQNTVEQEHVSLSNNELCMLLEDLHAKCKFRLKPVSKIGGAVSAAGYTRLLVHSESDLVHCVIGILPALCERMEGVVERNDEEFDGILDAQPDDKSAKLFELVFGIIQLVLGWPSFNQHADITTEFFDVLSSRLNHITQGPLSSRKKLAGNYLLSYSDNCLTLGSMLSLLRCVTVLQSSFTCPTLQHRIGAICKKTLEKEWTITQTEKESKLRVNEGVGALCQMYIKFSSEGVSVSIEYLIGCLGEVVGGEKSSDTLPMINKQSLSAVYKALLTELLRYQQNIAKEEDKMLTLGVSIQFFSHLVTFIKTVETRPVLSAVIKHGQKFLDVFLSQGIPIMDSMFKEHYSEFQKMLKSLQQSTRLLHHVSSHTKVVKDVGLTARVPLLKKSLEAFVLKVKAILAAHGCKDAFWMGNLKNRNLKGEEIVTQVAEEEEDESLSELSVTGDEAEGPGVTGDEAEGPDSDSLSVDY